MAAGSQARSTNEIAHSCSLPSSRPTVLNSDMLTETTKVHTFKLILNKTSNPPPLFITETYKVNTDTQKNTHMHSVNKGICSTHRPQSTSFLLLPLLYLDCPVGKTTWSVSNPLSGLCIPNAHSTLERHLCNPTGLHPFSSFLPEYPFLPRTTNIKPLYLLLNSSFKCSKI